MDSAFVRAVLVLAGLGVVTVVGGWDTLNLPWLAAEILWFVGAGFALAGALLGRGG